MKNSKYIRFTALAALSMSGCLSNPSNPTAATALSPASSVPIPETLIQIGEKKWSPSAQEFDPKCEQLIAPFDLTDNIPKLIELTTSITLSETVSANDNTANGSKGGRHGLKHNIGLATRRAAARLNWLPMELEVLYGEYILDKRKDSLISENSKAGRALYPKAEALIDSALGPIKEPTPYKFKVHVSSSAGENAEALPGGFIVIDKALLERHELKGKAQFAVSHEIAHVLQRHQTRAMQAQIIDTVSLTSNVTELYKVIKDSKEKPKEVLKYVLAGKLIFQKHFEDQELQADACAARILDTTFKNRTNVVSSIRSFVSRLPPPEPEVTKDDEATALFKVVTRPIDQHPTTNARIANLNFMVKEIYGGKAKSKS